MTSHKKYLGLALLLAFSAFAQVDTSSIQMFETLDEVEIDRDPGVRLSKKSVLSKELISEVELRKAAVVTSARVLKRMLPSPLPLRMQ